MSELDSSPRSSDEIAELQAHVRKFEAHLNDLELELYDTARERDEARQRAEWYEVALRAIREEGGRVCHEFDVCDHTACRSSYTAWTIADAALAVDQPAEAGGEEG